MAVTTTTTNPKSISQTRAAIVPTLPAIDGIERLVHAEVSNAQLTVYTVPANHFFQLESLNIIPYGTVAKANILSYCAIYNSTPTNIYYAYYDAVWNPDANKHTFLRFDPMMSLPAGAFIRIYTASVDVSILCGVHGFEIRD